MMIQKIYCDICSKECDISRLGCIRGTVMKMDEKAQIKMMKYGGELCEDDFLKVADFIENLKNAQHNNTSAISDQTDPKRTNT